MPLSKIRPFRPKPGHLAVCHAFADPLDRRHALGAPCRAQITAEHLAMASALETLARISTRFAATLDRLDGDASCNPSLQSNLLLMSSQATAGLSTRYAEARRLAPPAAAHSPLEARLVEPITLPRIVDPARFEELQEMRQDVSRLISDLSARFTDLYYASLRITIGELRERLHSIAHEARGEILSPARSAPVPAPITAPIPEAA